MELFMLTGCWEDRDGTLYVDWLLAGSILPTASQNKVITYIKCCIYRVVPPDDEQ